MPRRKVPVPPSPEVLDRIKRELDSPGFLSSLTAWADRQCGKLLSIEDRVDPGKATDLVNAAIVDTCDGVRLWHSEARTLRRHLEQTINSRLSHELERARRRRFVTLATTSVDDSQDAAAAIEIAMSEQREDPRSRPDAQLAQREVRARVFDTLRQRATRDDHLLALLDAYEMGHSRQADAEAQVGLRGQAFQNLVRRFKTIRGHIPQELRADAFDVMVRDGGAPLTTVVRHKHCFVEVAADQDGANDSRDVVSGDGDHGENSGDGTDREVA